MDGRVSRRTFVTVAGASMVVAALGEPVLAADHVAANGSPAGTALPQGQPPAVSCSPRSGQVGMLESGPFARAETQARLNSDGVW